ncbi:hypothetical protein [Evansella tamaricis]|uniref:Uncharacterized protein n=1 Tax=Evansella tamaricis TaxID=2069301 RepID=A0ABS6JG43_9BACI|nr:hypothetical protein [Evansella tamaricis]MBU9711308.1 hypothetical protein [Evansella tamaricis]
MRKYTISKEKNENFKRHNDHKDGRIHYQVYLQEDRPPQPKEVDEIEY